MRLVQLIDSGGARAVAVAEDDGLRIVDGAGRLYDLGIEAAENVGHRTRPIRLDGERTVAAPVADGLAQGAPAKRRIAGRNRPLERQTPEQRQSRRRLLVHRPANPVAPKRPSLH